VPRAGAMLSPYSAVAPVVVDPSKFARRSASNPFTRSEASAPP
jgi:hypothetical protein